LICDGIMEIRRLIARSFLVLGIGRNSTLEKKEVVWLGSRTSSTLPPNVQVILSLRYKNCRRGCQHHPLHPKLHTNHTAKTLP
jgi:hypothetical protein